jgi:hypothetical protein
MVVRPKLVRFRPRLSNPLLRPRMLVARILIALAAMLAPLMFAGTALADTGDRCYDSYYYSGINIFKMHYCFRVEYDSGFNNARFRTHVYCYKNSNPTNCNIDVDNGYFAAKGCMPQTSCSLVYEYGPSDWNYIPNVPDAVFVGQWHPWDTSVNAFRTRATDVAVRFLEVNHLIDNRSGCSYWAGWDAIGPSDCSGGN